MLVELDELVELVVVLVDVVVLKDVSSFLQVAATPLVAVWINHLFVGV